MLALLGMQDVGALVELDPRTPVPEVLALDSSLILPDELKFVSVMTKARRDLIIAKQVGVVFDGTDEEAIESYAIHLVANCHGGVYLVFCIG